MSTHTPVTVSPNGLRIHKALISLSSGQPQVQASYEAIIKLAKCARASVSAGIRELIAVGAIQKGRRFGSACVYLIVLGDADVNSSSVLPFVHPCSHSFIRASNSAPIRSSVLPDMNDLNDDDERHKKMRAIVSEFVSDEPWLSDLVHLLVAFVDQPDVIRAKGRESQAPQFKYPKRVAYKKLRALALGIADPMPLFALPEPQQPQAPAWKRRPAQQRRGGGGFRREQVTYTDEQRKAAEDRARAALAEGAGHE